MTDQKKMQNDKSTKAWNIDRQLEGLVEYMKRHFENDFLVGLWITELYLDEYVDFICQYGNWNCLSIAAVVCMDLLLW